MVEMAAPRGAGAGAGGVETSEVNPILAASLGTSAFGASPINGSNGHATPTSASLLLHHHGSSGSHAHHHLDAQGAAATTAPIIATPIAVPDRTTGPSLLASQAAEARVLHNPLAALAEPPTDA
jgi:hypothetical protein